MNKIHIYPNPQELGTATASMAANILRQLLGTQAEVNLILATGTSQFEMLHSLVQQPGIDWKRITAFHLDEYIGIPKNHPASFRKYLLERFISKVPLREFIEVNGEAPDPELECERLSEWTRAKPVDLAMIGIGENGHIAFNDPPADFKTHQPYIIVELDLACRNQQVGEGWFKELDEVPTHAISMSVNQILLSKHILCTVPDLRKAPAVQATVEGPVTPNCPASILRNHPNFHLFLDEPAASLLKGLAG